MTTIIDAELLDFNRQGIIPGPGEDEEHFLARAAYCKGLRALCAKPEESCLLPCEQEKMAFDLLMEASALTKPLYDIVPEWIPIAFSNYRLAPWHGGCAWIFQAHADTPTGAFLQLRRAFRDHTRYLGLYRRDELVAHELCHVGRMEFEEPQFEELLAYRTSHAPWRRWLGPIVQSHWESALFFLCLLLVLMSDIYLQFTGQYETYRLLFWAKAIPVGLLMAGLIRVWRRQKVYKKCLTNLVEACRDSTSANAIAYRLTDAEMKKFADMDVSGIHAYSEEQKNLSLRWRLIHLAYFH